MAAVNDRDVLLQNSGIRVYPTAAVVTQNNSDNLVQNSSFENFKDSPTAGLADGWTAFIAGTTGTPTYSRPVADTDRVFGIYGQRIYASNLGTSTSDRAGFYQNISIKNMGLTPFRLSLYAKIEVGTPKLSVYLQFLNSIGGIIDTTFAIQSVTTSLNTWEHIYSDTIAPPNGTETIKMFVWETANGVAGPAQIAVDGVVLSLGQLIPFYSAGFPDNINTNISVDATGNLIGIGTGTGTSVANNTNMNIRVPGGGILYSASGVGTQPGNILVTLPVASVTGTGTSIQFIVDILEVGTGLTCSMLVAGYISTSTWSSVTARVLGGSNVEYPVRFGLDTGGGGTNKLAVWIGKYPSATQESWTVVTARVRDVLIGIDYTTYTLWDDGWTVLVTTREPGALHATVDDTLPGANWNEVVNIPSNIYEAGFYGQNIDNSLISTDTLSLITLSLINDGNCTFSGNQIVKSAGGNAWNAGMHSQESFTGGAFAYIVATTGQDIIFGLNELNTVASYSDITYAIYLDNTNTVRIYREGTIVGTTFGSYVNGDVFAITYDGYAVKFLKNGTTLYQFAIINTLPLFFDCSIYQQGAVIKGIKFGPLTTVSGKNLINSRVWVVGTVPSTSPYFQNDFIPNATSSGGSNTIVLDTLADGTKGNVWTAISGSAVGTNAEGGWQSGVDIPIDHTKMYRYTVWTKRATGGDNITGRVYLGPKNSTVRTMADVLTSTSVLGGVEPFPYFENPLRSLLPLDVWCLIVGYVFPSNYNGNTTNLSGIYRVDTGIKIAGTTQREFRWIEGQNISGHKAFQYYTSVAGNKQLFYDPRIELVDGTEPSIGTMLSDAALTVAGGKIKTFIQSSIPVSLSIGDIWYDTDNNNRVYRAYSVGADTITTGDPKEWEEIGGLANIELVPSITTAQTTANNAQTAANTANTALTNIASDSILSPSEKPRIVQDYNVISTEQTGIDQQATAYGITTEKTAYDNAVAALTSYLNGLTGWNVIPGSDVAIVGTTFRANFALVYTTRQALLDKIAEKSGTTALWTGVTGIGKPTDNATVNNIFSQASAPVSGMVVGDLWFDTDSNNHLYRYNGAGPGWVSVRDAAATNFDNRNDRIATAVTAPTIASNGTAIDHTVSTDGSANISFEWSWGGAEADIDGFFVYMRQSSSGTAYTMGTTPAEEWVVPVPADKRAHIFLGVAANLYYTFGIRAYRIVDPDINAAEILKSTLVQPALAAEAPYQPSTTVAFTGDVSGTVNGIAATSVNVWSAVTGTGKPTDNATADNLLPPVLTANWYPVSARATVVAGGAGDTSPYLLRFGIGGTGSDAIFYSGGANPAVSGIGMIRCEPGQKYRNSFRLISSGVTASNFYCAVYYLLKDNTFSSTDFFRIISPTFVTSWTEYVDTFTVPANAVGMWIRFGSDVLTAGTFWVERPTLVKAIDTTQIVDGAVTDAKINSLSANKINVGSLRGINVQSSAFVTKGTYLVGVPSVGATTVNVDNTIDFDSSGSFIIHDNNNDRDIVSYTAKTSTSFTGCSGILGSHTNGALVTPLAQTMAIDNRVNEMRFYGNIGNGSIEELASIGINLVGSDYVVGKFGSNTNGSSRQAIYAISYSGTAGYFTSHSGTGIYSISNSSYGLRGHSTTAPGIYGTTDSDDINMPAVMGESVNSAIGIHGITYDGIGIKGTGGFGTGIYGWSQTGFGGKFDGNSTKPPLFIQARTTAPSNVELGGVCIILCGTGIYELCMATGSQWVRVRDYQLWSSI